MKIEINNTNGTVIIDGVTYARVEAQDDESKPWPQEDDTCFLLWFDGDIARFRYRSFANHPKWLAQGSLFRTRAEAEAERDRRAAEHRVLTRLRELSGDWVADWDDRFQAKSFPFVYGPDQQLGVDATWSCKGAPSKYYGPQDVWAQVIDEMPDDVRRMLG